MMTSAAETPSPLWMPVGMPRPLSLTVHEPSGLSVTVTCVGMAGERLVDAVVDDLVDHVVQAGAVVGVADIHARALAHRIEALEDLDRFGAVLVALRDGFGFVHDFPLCAAPSRTRPLKASDDPQSVAGRHQNQPIIHITGRAEFRPPDRDLDGVCALHNQGRKGGPAGRVPGPREPTPNGWSQARRGPSARERSARDCGSR